MAEDKKNGVELNGIQVVSSALAAVSSAVLLSTVGVAGTVIGAAAGSVIATVGGAIYSYSLRTSRERVAAAQALAASRVRAARSVHQTRPMDQAGTEPGAQPTVDLDEGPAVSGTGARETPAWRGALAGLPWKVISLSTVGIFVLAMAAIFAFEVLAGHPVSAYTGGSPRDDGGTSFTGTRTPKPTPTPSPTPSPTKSTSPSASPTSSPSDSATPSESTTSTSATPSETPSDSASESSSPSPTETPTPSDSASAGE